MESGIYSIKNLINGILYVGSSVNLKRRWKEHVKRLNTLDEPNQHINKHLYAAWNKYGQENFEFRVLEYCKPEKEELLKVEQFYIDLFGFENLYNHNPIAGSCLGRKLSDTHKERISISNKGRYGTMLGKKWKSERHEKFNEPRPCPYCSEPRKYWWSKDGHRHTLKTCGSDICLKSARTLAGKNCTKVSQVVLDKISELRSMHTLIQIAEMLNIDKTTVSRYIRVYLPELKKVSIV